MEHKDMHTENEEMWQRAEKSHRRGKVFGGLLIVIFGSIFLAKELGVEIPYWIFSWKTFLIAIGLVIGIKHNFQNPKWIIPVLIGGVFLFSDLFPEFAIRPILWPVIIIMFGLFMMFKPRRRRMDRMRHWQHRYNRRHERWSRYENCGQETTSTTEDFIDSVSFMGGVKKNILSKNFKGGDIVNVFGGAEINLTQADFEKSATINLTNVFGGTKLIVPAHWEINSELVSVLGSIEDKRPVLQGGTTEPSKILVLKGTTFFGGIDITSY